MIHRAELSQTEWSAQASVVDSLCVELAAEPGSGTVFYQGRNVDSDPSSLQRVIFLRDNPFNAVPGRCREAGCEPVRNLADDGFLLCIAHQFSVS